MRNRGSTSSADDDAGRFPRLEPGGREASSVAPPITRRREALGLAVLIWNAAILDRNGGGHVAMLLEQLALLPEPGRSILTQLAEELHARKKEQYADDLRVIVRWELTEVAPGQLSLEVEGAPAA